MSVNASTAPAQPVLRNRLLVGWMFDAMDVGLFAITIGIGAVAVALLGSETRGDLAVQ